MKIKLFTHTDFDGVGCSILAKLAYGDNVEVEYVNYNDVNEKVKEFILSDNVYLYNKIFITDISVNVEVANHIQHLIDNEEIGEFILLDHHKTAEYLNVYDWATITECMSMGDKQSGTHMLFEYLYDNKLIANIKNTFEFSTIVRKYDTWEFVDKYNDIEPKQFNDLLYIMGREDFIDNMINKIKLGQVCLNDMELKLLEYKQRDIDKYIESKSKLIIREDILGYKAGIVFAEQYISELGNKLCEMNADLDFIAIINMSHSISYRSVKDNIHLGNDIAKVYYNGGGHAKAAGSVISDKIRSKVIGMIFC